MSWRGGGVGEGRPLRVKVDESKLLSVSRVSDGNTGIDQSLDMWRVVLSGYQDDIRVCRLAHCIVHDILENVLQLKDVLAVRLLRTMMSKNHGKGSALHRRI